MTTPADTGAQNTLSEYLASWDTALSELNTGRIHPQQYVNRHGRQFTSQPLTPAERSYTELIHWHRCRPNQCYRNSQLAALTLPPHPGITLRYAEGYFSMGWGIGIEHAWLSLNGKLLDLTLRDPDNRPILGLIPEDHEYIGVEFHTALCRHAVLHRKHISLIDDYECRHALLSHDPKTLKEPLPLCTS